MMQVERATEHGADAIARLIGEGAGQVLRRRPAQRGFVRVLDTLEQSEVPAKPTFYGVKSTEFQD